MSFGLILESYEFGNITINITEDNNLILQLDTDFYGIYKITVKLDLLIDYLYHKIDLKKLIEGRKEKLVDHIVKNHTVQTTNVPNEIIPINKYYSGETNQTLTIKLLELQRSVRKNDIFNLCIILFSINTVTLLTDVSIFSMCLIAISDLIYLYIIFNFVKWKKNL